MVANHIKAVIFDMDGVIVDSESFWKQAEEEVFTSLGVQITEEYSELTRSMTTAEVTHFWYNKYPWQNKSLEEVEQLVVSKVSGLIKSEECIIKGVKALIKKLKDRNYKIGLATNSPYTLIPEVLRKSGISTFFDAISSAEFEKKGKPDPAIYLTTAADLDTEPKHCLVIEDSYTGMLAAKRAGMTVLGFSNGNKDKFFELADFRIDDFENDELKFFSWIKSSS